MPDLDARFRCPVFNCELSVKACLLRHTKTWCTGGRAGAKVFQRCGSCALGADLLTATPAFVPPPASEAPALMPRSQREARARWLGCRPFDAGPAEPDPMREAADLAPEDDGLEPDLG